MARTNWFFAPMLGSAAVVAAAACSSSSSGGNPASDSGADTTAGDSGEETAPDGMPADVVVDSPVEAPNEAGHMEAGGEGGRDSGDAGGSDGSDGEAGPTGPLVLVNDAPNATLIATDGVNVYWGDWVAGDAGQHDGRIMRVPVSGGQETRLAATPGATPTALAIDGANVFWVGSDGSLEQVPKAGGTVLPLASGASAPIAASGGSVFYAASGSAGVSKIAAGGGTPSVLATTGAPVDMVVVAGNVFWAETRGVIDYVSAGAGGTPVDLVAPDPDAATGEFVSNTALQNLTTDGTSLYWNRAPGAFSGAVMSVPVGGGPPQVVTNIAQDSPLSVATDGTSVFFLDVSAMTKLVASSVAGGTPTTMTTADLGAAAIAGVSGPTVAVDQSNVYWLNPPQIAKIAK